MGVVVGPRQSRQPRYLRILFADRWAKSFALFLLVVPIAAVTMKRNLTPVVTQVVVIFMAALAVALWWRLLAVGALVSRGVATMARIISVDWRVSWFVRDPPRDSDYPTYAYVTVRYVFAGREYNVGRNVNHIAANAIAPGADIEVLVDPSSPDRFVFAHLS